MKTNILSILLLVIAIISLSCSKSDDDIIEEIEVLSFSNVELGSQNNPTGCFLGLRNGTVYSTGTAFENQSQIDLVFWYNRDVGGAGSTATWFTSPAGTMSYYGTYHQEDFIFSTQGLNNWQTLNNTEIGHLEITSAQFDAIQTVNQLTTSFNSDQRIFGNSILPKVNDILRFRAHNGKLAIMRVKSITGNAGSINGKMLIDIKVIP